MPCVNDSMAIAVENFGRSARVTATNIGRKNQRGLRCKLEHTGERSRVKTFPEGTRRCRLQKSISMLRFDEPLPNAGSPPRRRGSADSP